jgi:hypothetical protein
MHLANLETIASFRRRALALGARSRGRGLTTSSKQKAGRIRLLLGTEICSPPTSSM